IPLLDARRMEVYSQVFSEKNEKMREVTADIIDSDSFSEYLNAEKVYFFGDGAEKCKGIITHKNAVFIDDKFPSSKEMSVISYQKYLNNEFEDVAYFEPFYLKEFLGVISK
ncbi:MAG: tRNA (adenosine(37)-N6)-threonylcarbamoyltransferase complex dimerization subunit type 1 TsaB, partial [Lutibacter sp.]